MDEGTKRSSFGRVLGIVAATVWLAACATHEDMHQLAGLLEQARGEDRQAHEAQRVVLDEDRRARVELANSQEALRATHQELRAQLSASTSELSALRSQLEETERARKADRESFAQGIESLVATASSQAGEIDKLSRLADELRRGRDEVVSPPELETALGSIAESLALLTADVARIDERGASMSATPGAGGSDPAPALGPADYQDLLDEIVGQTRPPVLPPAPAPGTPVRLLLTAPDAPGVAGGVSVFELSVVDVDGAAVQTSEDLTVWLKAKQDGTVLPDRIVLKKGEGPAQISVRPAAAGLLEVRAWADEIRGDVSLIWVDEDLAIGSDPPGGQSSWWRRWPGLVGVAYADDMGGSGFELPIPQIRLETTILSGRESPRAGEETLIVTAVLDDVAKERVEIDLSTDRGRFDPPEPLVIPKDKHTAKTELQNPSPSRATVKFLGARPNHSLHPDSAGMANFVVDFAAPIASLRVKPKRSDLNLADRGEIKIQLLDKNKRLIAASEPVLVTLSLTEGYGMINSAVEVSVGSSEAIAVFHPAWNGTSTIEAEAPGLDPQAASVHVSIPIVLLAFSLLGGLLGGCIGFATQRAKGAANPWLRIIFGLAGGPMIFWLLAFTSITLHIAPNVIQNPIGVIGLALTSGIAGDQILALASRVIGVGDPPQPVPGG